MQLLTEEIRKAFEKYPLYSQDGKGIDAIVVTKFFDPCGRFTFYATEGSPDGGEDFRLFGWCVSQLGEDCDEWSYASMNELQAARNKLKLGLERDTSVPIAKKTLSEVRK